MDLALARSNSIEHTEAKSSPAPAAERMSLEAYERSYKNTDKKLGVPLMKTGEQFPSPDGNAVLPASDPTAKLYMEARESMGRVITSNGNVVGSGFFVNKDGLFSTLYHVTEDGSEIVVETGDGKTHAAHVVAQDPGDDLVLLQVEKNTKNESFHPVKVAPASELKPGEEVLACGFGETTVLHCSPGIYDFSLHQKDIKLKEQAPFLDPNRELLHSKQHTVNGDSGGLEFRMSDGTVRLLVDMTDNNKNTVSIPAERLLELEAKYENSAAGRQANK